MKKMKVIFSILLLAMSIGAFTFCVIKTGKPGEQGPQGEPGVQGPQGNHGQDGHTPIITIGNNGNWFIDGVDTGVKAEAEDGNNGIDGIDGVTPHIGANGNWWIGNTDTGVKAEAQDGSNGTDGIDGVTPHIGANGNWWIGNTDTGVKAEAQDGTNGTDGIDGVDGLSAYEIYLKYHPEYKGTEAEWIDDLINGRLNEEEKHTVTFIVEDSVYLTEVVFNGDKVVKPENPIKPGYSFNNWVDEDGEQWVFNGYSITEDINLYATWTPNTYLITLDSNGGQFQGFESNSFSINYGCSFDLNNYSVSKEGYDFCGWYYNDELVSQGIYNYLQNITLVAKWKEIIDFKYRVLDSNSIEITGYTGSGKEVIIPEKIDEYVVTSIGDSAFSRNYNIKSVVIPNTVTTIKNEVFSNCDSLESVEIPASVTSIGNIIFNHCNSIKKITVAEGNSIYDSRDNCNAIIETATDTLIYGIETTIIPYSVKIIGQLAFYTGLGLEVIEIPFGVEIIGGLAFAECYTLKTIIISTSVTKIEASAFNGCFNLSDIYYMGTIEEWESISVEAGNDNFKTAKLYHYSEMQPIEEGNYWHYDSEGNIVIWEDVTYVVTFDFNYDSKIDTQTVLPNELILEPSDPVRESYGFIGWYNGAEEWDFNKDVVVNDMSLTAKWVESNLFNYEISDNTAEIKGFRYFTTAPDKMELIIPKNINGYPVTSITDYAFEQDSYITKLKISSTVTSIGEGAFGLSMFLESVYISSSVTFIDLYAFAACSKLTTIVVDSENPVYDSRDNCNAIIETSTNTLILGIENTIIPSSVTEIGEYAFAYDENVNNIILPSSITVINENAFEDCMNLTSIIIPKSITDIKLSAFAGCNSLEYVYYEGTKTEWNNINIESSNNSLKMAVIFYSENEPLEAGNFWHYDDEGNIVLWPSIKTFNVVFDSNVGSNVDTQTVLPNSLVIEPEDPVSDEYGFVGWYNGDEEWNFDNDTVTEDIILKARWIYNIYFSYVIKNNEVKISWYLGFEQEVIIPKSIKGYQVTTLGESSFSQKELKTVYFPKTLTTIEDFAFCSCVNLESVYIPSNVSQIGLYAFADCTNLTSIVVSPQNGVYDSRDNCNAIIETANNALISGCKNTVIPSTITSIEESAFSYCEGLTELVIPFGLTSIGDFAFEDCINLNSVVIPSTVTTIGENAFSGCKNLIIYYEGYSIPSTWDSSYNPNQCPIYYNSEWKYDENGIPTIIKNDNGIYEVEGIKYINYGSYPQTHINDEELISELNNLTIVNERGYYEYGGEEYAKVNATPYHSGSYTDSLGNTKYYQYSDGSTIDENAVEWFLVESIKWRIISENEDGSYQLYSEYILDAMSYCQLFDVRNVDGEEIYVNNYKYSNVRAWLNGYDGTGYEMPDYSNIGFYNLAFSEEEKEKIIIHEVDNSLSTTNSTSNDFLCENTFDNIYLLSANDLENSNYGFTSYESRCAKVTDYAKAVGAYWYNSSTYKDQGYYWLRSPYGSSGNLAFYVYNDGGINSFATLYEICGIRAACTIKS